MSDDLETRVARAIHVDMNRLPVGHPLETATCFCMRCKDILALVQREVAAERRTMIRALCRSHDRQCLLDNGRVWAMCGGWRLIDGGIPEEEIAAAIRAEEPRDG